jgi:DivIVA domain-containing protein
MELSPQAVAAATFRTVKRGYDPDEVRAYLIEVSASLEASHQQATAMEARARAAIAKLQDATQQTQHAGPATAPAVPAEEAETISRTLLLAQRTADLTVADAKAEAAAVTEAAAAEAAAVASAAKLEAVATLEQARAEAARLLDDARAEAHRVRSEELQRVEAEVRDLGERRAGLQRDLDAIGRLGAAQRTRLREIGARLTEIADEIPVEIPVEAKFHDLAAPSGTAVESAHVDPAAHVDLPPPVGEQVPSPSDDEASVSRSSDGASRPTSADEVRSLWQQAEAAEHAGDPAPAGDGADATPVDAAALDASTPADGFRR